MMHQSETTSCNYEKDVAFLSFAEYESSVLCGNDVKSAPKKVFIDIWNETHTSTTETAISTYSDDNLRTTQLLTQIRILVDRILKEEEIFKTIDKNKLLEEISKIITELSPDVVRCSDEELERRIRQIMALEIVSGMLNDLNREQIEIFDETVKRRPLFK